MKPGESSRFFGHLNNTGRYDFRIGARKPVLEVGPGSERLVPKAGGVTVGREGKVDVRADAFRLPFKDGAFGLAVAREVFCVYSADEQRRLMEELFRVADAVYARQWKGCAWADCGFKIGEAPPF